LLIPIMTPENLYLRDFDKEFKITFSRSSGPGGQNVNKVNTRVELRFNVLTSECLTYKEKEIVLKKNINKINSDGELILSSQLERSQLRNKEHVIEKFYILLAKSLTPRKKRKLTSPTRASREKRLENKRLKSEKKQIRRKTDL
jgi:ribosome-associated protein